MKAPRKSRKRSEASRWIVLDRINVSETNSPRFNETSFGRARAIVGALNKLGRAVRVFEEGSALVFRARK